MDNIFSRSLCHMNILRHCVKGLDFTWASASNAEKAEVAMQMFFENTEQYAGNFARESTETITGSLGLLQAALGSFTAGLGNADADMTNLTQNLVDAFQSVVKNIVPVLENIVAALPTATGAILQAVGDLLPMLLEVVTQLFTQVLQTILNLLPRLIPAAVDAVMTIVGALIDNLPLLINAAVQLVTALVNGIGSGLPQLIPAAVSAVMQIVQGLLENLPLILDAALQLVIGLADGILNAIPVLIEALPEVIAALVDFLIGSIPQIIEAGIRLLTSLITALPIIIETVVMPNVDTQSVRTRKLLSDRKQEVEKIRRIADNLYVDWKGGEISRTDYQRMKKKFEKQIDQIETVIMNLEEEQRRMDKSMNDENPLFTEILKWGNIEKLDRNLLVELVDTIYVHENKEITIVFRFQDELERIFEFVELNTKEQK